MAVNQSKITAVYFPDHEQTPVGGELVRGGVIEIQREAPTSLVASGRPSVA